MTVRVNISLPREFLRRLDTAAARDERSRSQYIRRAVERQIAVSDSAAPRLKPQKETR